MGRPLRTHLELLKPDLAGKVRCSQTSQKMARDGRSKQRVFYPSETVYIRKSDKESQWIPGIIESKLGDYTYLIRLDNNQTVCRHMTIFDQGSVKWFQIRMTMTYGGLHHFSLKFALFFGTCHNFFPLSSVQLIIIPPCCLLCVL